MSEANELTVREGAKYPDTAWGRIRAYLDNATAELSRVDLGELLAENVQLKRKLEWPVEQPQDDGDVRAVGDITPEPTADERLAEITNRSRYLRGVSFDTHGTHDGCPACELVRGVDDVEWLLAENQRLREERVSRELEDRHIDRTLAMLVLRFGGRVEFTEAEMTAAPAHGEFVCMREMATGAMVLAFQAAESAPQQPESGGDGDGRR